MFSTRRTWNIMFCNPRFHLFFCPSIHTGCNFNVMFLCKIFNNLIRTESFFTFFTIHKRIAESTQMTGCHPCLRIHKDCAVHTYIIRIFLHKLFPPCTFYIILQFYTKVTIIPCICKAAVDFRTRIYKSS